MISYITELLLSGIDGFCCWVEWPNFPKRFIVFNLLICYIKRMRDVCVESLFLLSSSLHDLIMLTRAAFSPINSNHVSSFFIVFPLQPRCETKLKHV